MIINNQYLRNICCIFDSLLGISKAYTLFLNSNLILFETPAHSNLVWFLKVMFLPFDKTFTLHDLKDIFLQRHLKDAVLKTTRNIFDSKAQEVMLLIF